MIGLGAGSSPVVSDMANQTFYTFDGTDQQIIPHADVVTNIANAVTSEGVEFSISAWFKINTVSASRVLFKLFRNGVSTDQLLLIYHASGNEMRFSSKFNNVNDLCQQGTNSMEGDGNWHHVIGTCSSTDNTTELWIDGSKVDDNTTGVGTPSVTFDTVAICTNGAGGGFWDGSVDSLAVYTRQLQDTEIAKIYEAGVGGLDLVSAAHVDPTGLVLLHRFEEKSGTVCINEAGQNSTYRNSPTVVQHNGAFS